MCRQSYVHPAVLDAFRDGSLADTWAHSRHGRHLSRPERALLRTLDQQEDCRSKAGGGRDGPMPIASTPRGQESNLRAMQDRLDKVTRDINDARLQLGWDRVEPALEPGEPPTEIAPPG